MSTDSISISRLFLPQVSNLRQQNDGPVMKSSSTVQPAVVQRYLVPSPLLDFLVPMMYICTLSHPFLPSIWSWYRRGTWQTSLVQPHNLHLHVHNSHSIALFTPSSFTSILLPPCHLSIKNRHSRRLTPRLTTSITLLFPQHIATYLGTLLAFTGGHLRHRSQRRQEMRGGLRSAPNPNATRS